MIQTVEAEKAALRANLRGWRRTLDEDFRRRAAASACARLRGSEAWQSARVIMAYWAVRGELSLYSALQAVLESGRTLVMPRCEGMKLAACRIDRLEALHPGRMGIPEPDGSCQVIAPERIDLVIVPGVAFDRRGGRLGQGGGFYDRFLPNLRARRVGACYDECMLPSVPMGESDVRMHAVLTPSALWRVEGEADE